MTSNCIMEAKPKKVWRCSRCQMRLGVLAGPRLHIRFTRGGHEYIVGFPVTCLCKNCKTLNELHETDMTAEAEDVR